MGTPEFVIGPRELWVACGEFCGTEPLNLWSLMTFSVVNVRIELNCWTSC